MERLLLLTFHRFVFTPSCQKFRKRRQEMPSLLRSRPRDHRRLFPEEFHAADRIPALHLLQHW
ncbi:hypothetical protein C2S52_003429 [Perilla frutescens var. hirtella]|nr:hypothetical protein C2S52_003429 [Perilla frutescens var. hirtella]